MVCAAAVGLYVLVFDLFGCGSCSADFVAGGSLVLFGVSGWVRQPLLVIFRIVVCVSHMA